MHKTTHNAALALETLVLKIKHSEPVEYLNYVGYIVMRRNVLFDRWVKLSYALTASFSALLVYYVAIRLQKQNTSAEKWIGEWRAYVQTWRHLVGATQSKVQR